MNWQAGILAFALFWIPTMCIFIWMRKRDQEIDREYKEKIKQIEKHYGVKL